MKSVDYLIVGQGIVGSVMALTLFRLGKSVVVIDQPKLSSSSKVAAGVYNPFNFRQAMNNWRALELVNSAQNLYGYAEKFQIRKFIQKEKYGKYLRMQLSENCGKGRVRKEKIYVQMKK